MKIMSIDIGIKNFCVYIEEFNEQQLKNIENIDKTKRYNLNGTCKKEFEDILNLININSKTIYHENKNLIKDKKGKCELNADVYVSLVEYLDSIKNYINDCDIIVIEKQFTRNIKALKLAQHCSSYFYINYKKEKEIIEFQSYYKTKILGAERKVIHKNNKIKFQYMKQKERKSWAITKCYDILKIRNEQNIIENIKSKSKKDDLADTVIMSSAFKYLRFVDKII